MPFTHISADICQILIYEMSEYSKLYGKGAKTVNNVSSK